MRIVAPAIALAMAVAACGGDDGDDTGGTSEAKPGGTLRFGPDQEPTGWNTNTSADNGFANQVVIVRVLPSAFLVKPDFTVVPDPDLNAEEPKLEEVNGKQVVTYTIKPEAKWSDGQPIDVEDFKYLWESITSEGFDVASTTGYEDIESIEAGADAKTIVVTYKKKFADWKSLFSTILPSRYMKEQEAKLGGAKQSWETALKKDLPVSGGPFLVESFDTTNKIVTVVRNEQYWGQKAYLDKIIYQVLPESVTQPAALKNGEVDMIYPQPQLDAVGQVKALEPEVTSEINFGLVFEHLDLNTQQKDLADPNVRKAIAYGLDREAIVKAGPAQFDARAAVLNNRIYMNNQPEYVDNGGDYKSRSVEKAKDLLTQSGYTPGSDGIMTKGGKKLSLRFTTTQGNKLREDTGVLIKSQLKEIGIDVVIRNLPSTEYFGEALPAGDFDMGLFAWVGTPFAASANKSLYVTATPENRQSNYALVSDKRVDDAFDQVVTELDEQKVIDTMNQIDAWLWEDMATIPLYQKPTFLASRATFAGIKDNASSQSPFWDSEKWYLKQ
jgi:peptide/nickel transport system substrate-binding protein